MQQFNSNASILNNTKAKKLIQKLIDDTERNGIIVNTVVEDLKALRPFAIEEKRPLLAKTIRLVYEHFEENDSFDISIPDEEPIEDEETVYEVDPIESTPEESFIYLLQLLKDPENKSNILDLRSYVALLSDY